MLSSMSIDTAVINGSLFVSGPSLFRLLYLGNLPTDVSEAALREHFPEALQVIMPCDEETSERLG